jgi:DNA-binding transcriptional regulator YhcF (GntR family)
MREFTSIQLNKQGLTPVYRQLGDAFCMLIERGALKPHRKLPPIRKLANALRINNDTVINAYKYLENKGVVYSIVGSGTYVAPNQNEEGIKTCVTDCYRVKAYEQRKAWKPMERI